MKTKKLLIVIFMLLNMFFVNGQKVDQVIKTKIYTSYISYLTRTPLYVVYKLYNGGGKISRKDMIFSTDNYNVADYKDYKKSGYDIGHMCAANDFAYDSTLMKLTFKFYNTIPQAPFLNRGNWLFLESHIRKLSRSDSILIICGGWQWDKKINNMYVPHFCFKVFENLRTKETHYVIYRNTNQDSSYDCTAQVFAQKISYNIQQYLK